MSRRKRMMLLGASPYYARSIRRARALGYQVLALDGNPNAVGFKDADDYAVVDLTDADGALRAARDYHIDGVVPLHDYAVSTAAHVAAALGLVGISPEAAARATRKTLMRQAWDAAGLPRIRWTSASTIREAEARAAELGRWPLIVKPSDSRGGASRGVLMVSSPRELPDAVTFAQRWYPDPEVIIEECVQGLEHSVETLTWDGTTHVLAVSDKVKSAPPYRVDKSVEYPSRLDATRRADVEALATRAVRALGITIGAAHVELCTTSEGPRLFELGARCGGGGTPDPIVPFVSGIDMLGEVVRVHAGDPPGRLDPQESRAACYRFLTPSPGKLHRVEGLEEVARWQGILDCGVTLRPGDVVRPLREGIDRVGFVITGGDTRDEAVALADRAEAHIRFEYA
jgi:biotin carboxylase